MARVAALVAVLLAVACSAAAQGKVLVLLDSLDFQRSHSQFLDTLWTRGYALDIRAISDKKLQLKQWDDWLYEKLVILGSKSGGDRRSCDVQAPPAAGAGEGRARRCGSTLPHCLMPACSNAALPSPPPGRAGWRDRCVSDPGVCRRGP